MRLIALPAFRSTGPFASLFGPNQLDKTAPLYCPPPVALPTMEGVPKRVNHEMAMHTLSAYHHGLAVDEYYCTRSRILARNLPGG
jgi:hypothetical protein